MFRRELWATEEKWMSRSACSGLNPDLFFSEEPEDEATAKALCEGCPVRMDCLEFAFRKGIEHGIFGGLKDTERRSMLKRRGRAAVNELLSRRTVVV